jgi:ammonium transporter, Amt family
MQTGFALVESGVVQKKNEVNIMMKNIVDVCFGGLSFWMFGFGLMFGRGEHTNPFIAHGDFFVNANPGDTLMAPVLTFYFLQMSFATTSTTIVSGACAERFNFTAYCLFSFVNTVVYAGWYRFSRLC